MIFSDMKYCVAYVRNFGIDNFSMDTQLLWDLARLAQKYGKPGESVLLYKIVLKHAQTVDGKVRQEYDSATRKENRSVCASPAVL